MKYCALFNCGHLNSRPILCGLFETAAEFMQNTSLEVKEMVFEHDRGNPDSTQSWTIITKDDKSHYCLEERELHAKDIRLLRVIVTQAMSFQMIIWDFASGGITAKEALELAGDQHRNFAVTKAGVDLLFPETDSDDVFDISSTAIPEMRSFLKNNLIEIEGDGQNE
jgi:hypothetical protein